jgi:hypothetical protein
VSVLLWEPIGTDHQRIRQRKNSFTKTSTHVWSHYNLPGTEYFNCCLSSSQKIPQGHVTRLCVSMWAIPKREVWPSSFQVSRWCRTYTRTHHQKGETHNNPKRKRKKTNITIYGQATHIFTPAPTPAWKPTAAPPSRLVTYISLLFLHIDISSACRNRVVLPPHHLAFWQITINLKRPLCNFLAAINCLWTLDWGTNSKRKWMTSHFLDLMTHVKLFISSNDWPKWQPWENKRYRHCNSFVWYVDNLIG